uniref:Uncharacterized protein n=1 Tax=Quercus lobata TaxID=97700 RepID=A0A7N2M2A8_QUELO
MCVDFVNDFGMSSYISFLNSLISEGNDIQRYSTTSLALNSFTSHDYFSSPCTFLSLVGASLVLARTGTQTWYAIVATTSARI